METNAPLATTLFDQEQDRQLQSFNRFNGLTLIGFWFGLVAASYWASSSYWIGERSAVHPHVTFAILFGLLVGGIPGVVGILFRSHKAVPYMFAVCQMLMVGALTHVCHGRIEMHFAYFTSLALLASYREWRLLVVASAVAALDHVFRGLFFPYSIFGSDHVQFLRIVEHACWVIWEDVFLIKACLQSTEQLRRMSAQSQQQQEFAEESSRQVKTLLGAAATLSDVSEALTENSSRLVADAKESLAQAQNVAEQMTSVSTQISDVDASSKLISNNVSSSSARATESSAVAEKAMSEVSRLIESSQQISEVLETVQNLAFQTNLLSINASIEAARVGEAGEGFAVVAGEVRQLAVRSRESAETIASRIKAIQSNVTSVGSRLGEICNSVRQIASLTDNIKASTEVQAENVTSINASTALVKSAAQEMLRHMNEMCQISQTTSEAVGKTSELAALLRGLASKTTTVVSDQPQDLAA